MGMLGISILNYRFSRANLFAKMLGFTPFSFIEINDTEKSNVEVKF